MVVNDFDERLDGGREGIRTPDPGVANAVLSQLSYTPILRNIIKTIENPAFASALNERRTLAAELATHGPAVITI